MTATKEVCAVCKDLKEKPKSKGDIHLHWTYKSYEEDLVVVLEAYLNDELIFIDEDTTPEGALATILGRLGYNVEADCEIIHSEDMEEMNYEY